MRIGMPKNGEMINQHFGQSREFLIVNIENGAVTDKKVVGGDALQHNHAGLSGLFVNEGVSLVIVGGIGQPALNALVQNGLQVIRGASGQCDDILERYLRGSLQDQNVSCGHHGEHHHQ